MGNEMVNNNNAERLSRAMNYSEKERKARTGDNQVFY